MFYLVNILQLIIDRFDKSFLSKQDFILKQQQGIFHIPLCCIPNKSILH